MFAGCKLLSDSAFPGGGCGSGGSIGTPYSLPLHKDPTHLEDLDLIDRV